MPDAPTLKADVAAATVEEFAIARLDLKPGDIIVIKSRTQPDAYFMDEVTRFFLGRSVVALFLPLGTDLEVLDQAKKAELRAKLDGA